VSRVETIQHLKDRLTKFVCDVAEREEKSGGIFERIDRLDDIVHGRKQEFWFLPARLIAIERWLIEEGPGLRESALTQEHLNHITECIERIRDVREREGDKRDPRQVEQVNKVLELTNSFAVEAAKRLGLEYSPLGLVERTETRVEPVDDFERWKTLEAIRSGVSPADSTKMAYQVAVRYQNDMMEQFYVREHSLLSVLDFQLTNLEARYSEEDELFAAMLLYFLKIRKYKIAPYYSRFRQILAAREAESV
jgi:hypothetical protein